MEIYKAIKIDHDIQRDLCNRIIKTSGAPDERKKLWAELKKELQVHEVAEERHFYSALIETDKMQEDARHGIAEHHEMDEMIEELDELDMSSSDWNRTLEKLVDKVHHHLKDEENDFFTKAKDVYSEDDAVRLAQEYQNTMREYRESWPESIPGND